MARTKKPRLTPALARRAAALAAAKRARLLAQAHDDIAIVRQKQDAIASAFYEIGQALCRLARKDTIRALGHATFDEVLEQHVGFSRAQADRLMLIAEQIGERDAVNWRQDKSYAVAELLKLPGAKRLSRGRLELPSHDVIDLEKSSTAALAHQAELERHRLQGPSGARRGRTTTPDERRAAAELTRALEAMDVKATVTCVATKPGRPSDVRVRFSVTAVDALLARLRGGRRGARKG